jgi:hypothetical protein
LIHAFTVAVVLVLVGVVMVVAELLVLVLVLLAQPLVLVLAQPLVLTPFARTRMSDLGAPATTNTSFPSLNGSSDSLHSTCLRAEMAGSIARATAIPSVTLHLMMPRCDEVRTSVLAGGGALHTVGYQSRRLVW